MNNYYTCSFCGANEMDAKKLSLKAVMLIQQSVLSALFAA
ncbi:hypothetical protein CFSAN004346_13385 [Salmonella enterica subsp. enterica serovar Montevideo str. CFSAN004346]|nr:hypothetical protein CFSAN004346_13385 [Salmonella enterica subsp. enterica serovar Montevideo str. CFSAN004346]CAB3270249.1 unnamed protein product [Salmonella enterica subsp. enterica serovar Typhimurium]